MGRSPCPLGCCMAGSGAGLTSAIPAAGPRLQSAPSGTSRAVYTVATGERKPRIFVNKRLECRYPDCKWRLGPRARSLCAWDFEYSRNNANDQLLSGRRRGQPDPDQSRLEVNSGAMT